MSYGKKPSPDSYRLLIEQEWGDIHHSRVQEWTALGVVTGAHVGILQLFTFLAKENPNVSFPSVAVSGGILAAAFAVLGLLMTLRHRQLMSVKLGWIYSAEEFLGLIKTEENPHGVIPKSAEMNAPVQWNGLGIPRIFSTSWLLSCFYILFLLLVVGVVLFAILA